MVNDYQSEKAHPGTPGAKFASLAKMIFQGRGSDHMLRNEFSAIDRCVLSDKELEQIKNRVIQRLSEL